MGQFGFYLRVLSLKSYRTITAPLTNLPEVAGVGLKSAAPRRGYVEVKDESISAAVFDNAIFQQARYRNITAHLPGLYDFVFSADYSPLVSACGMVRKTVDVPLRTT